MTIKHSPTEAENFDAFVQLDVPEVTQHTDVKVAKVLFTKKDASQILWLGKYKGRCISLWKRDTSNDTEPFKVLTTKNVDVDPNDVCLLGYERVCVSYGDGSLSILSTDGEDISLVKKIDPLHNGCASRGLCEYENGVISASVNGSLAYVDVKTGISTQIASGQASIRSMCTSAGQNFIVTGSSTGQITIWDMREKNVTLDCLETAKELVPSLKGLDSITSLCSHPAQSNLICCGTDDGLIALVDIRNGENAMISGTYSVASKGISQVMFHPTCSDNLMCSSSDGVLLRIDASKTSLVDCGRGISKENVWLNDDLASKIQLESIRQDSVYPVSSFDCRGDCIIASSSIGLISAYENLPFFPRSNTDFLRH